MDETDQTSPRQIRDAAIAEGKQLYMLVRPDACPVCAIQRGKLFWADEAPLLPVGGCLKLDCQCEYRVFDPDGPSLDEMLSLGIAAARAGKMSEAQECLVSLLQIDRYHEQAWLWLSGAADNDQDRLDCIQEVLKINPDNTYAKRGLEALHSKGVGLPAEQAPPEP